MKLGKLKNMGAFDLLNGRSYLVIYSSFFAFKCIYLRVKLYLISKQKNTCYDKLVLKNIIFISFPVNPKV
jgi:hypothetical protein